MYHSYKYDNYLKNDFKEIFDKIDNETINYKYLLSIYKQNNSLLKVSSYPIINHFKEEEEKFIDFCNKENVSLIDIKKYIKNNLINTDFIGTNFCFELDKAHQTFNFSFYFEITRIENTIHYLTLLKRINSIFNKNIDIEECIKEIKENIISRFKIIFRALNIEATYNLLDKENEIVLHSHRKGGFFKQEIKINQNFTVYLETNFGYGRSSYFYTTVKYKGLIISPLSEWTAYRFANAYQIKNYTKVVHRYSKDKYGNLNKLIKQNYWDYAINFIILANNLALMNEKEFIDNFIKKETFKMIENIRKLVEYDEKIEFHNDYVADLDYEDSIFYIHKNNISVDKVTLEGVQLLSYKTEKILGAINFINKLVEYKNIFDTSSFIKNIIELTDKFLPYLNTELKKIKLIIAKNKNKLRELKDNLSEQKDLLEKKKGIDGYAIDKLEININNIKKEIDLLSKTNSHLTYNTKIIEEYKKNYMKEKSTVANISI